MNMTDDFDVSVNFGNILGTKRNAMIDHEELERVKKLEDATYLKSKNITFFSLQINPENEILVYEIWIKIKDSLKMELFSNSNLLNVKSLAMDFLEKVK